MGAIDIIFAIGFMVGIPMYKYWAEQNSMIYIPFVICISCLIVFYMMHFYIYLMISSTNLNTKHMNERGQNGNMNREYGRKRYIITMTISDARSDQRDCFMPRLTR